MLLSEVFNIQHIKLNLESETKEEAFEELVETIITLHPDLNQQELLKAIIMREKQMNTAIIPDVAIPHGFCHTLNGIVGVLGVSRVGIEYDTKEGGPVHCIFMVLMGNECREKHLSILSILMHVLNSPALLKMQRAQCAQEIYDILCQFGQTDMKEPI
jgi:PTS system fructose-specific IIC component/PTS system nitrogen regulatory IIA component